MFNNRIPRCWILRSAPILRLAELAKVRNFTLGFFGSWFKGLPTIRGAVEIASPCPPPHTSSDKAKGEPANPYSALILDNSVKFGSLKLSMQNNAKTPFFNNLIS